jgi:hypothetical protein
MGGTPEALSAQEVDTKKTGHAEETTVSVVPGDVKTDASTSRTTAHAVEFVSVSPVLGANALSIQSRTHAYAHQWVTRNAYAQSWVTVVSLHLRLRKLAAGKWKWVAARALKRVAKRLTAKHANTKKGSTRSSNKKFLSSTTGVVDAINAHDHV